MKMVVCLLVSNVPQSGLDKLEKQLTSRGVELQLIKPREIVDMESADFVIIETCSMSLADQMQWKTWAHKWAKPVVVMKHTRPDWRMIDQIIRSLRHRSEPPPAAAMACIVEREAPTVPTSIVKVVPVPFYGDTLDAIQRDDGIWLGVKRACENVGVDVEGQRKKLEKASWATTDIMSAVGADGKIRDVFCINLKSVPMWLSGIDANKVAEHVKAKLIRYQQECADVLAKHFLPAAVSSPLDVMELMLRQMRSEQEQRAVLAARLEAHDARIDDAKNRANEAMEVAADVAHKFDVAKQEIVSNVANDISAAWVQRVAPIRRCYVSPQRGLPNVDPMGLERGQLLERHLSSVAERVSSEVDIGNYQAPSIARRAAFWQAKAWIRNNSKRVLGLLNIPYEDLPSSEFDALYKAISDLRVDSLSFIHRRGIANSYFGMAEREMIRNKAA